MANTLLAKDLPEFTQEDYDRVRLIPRWGDSAHYEVDGGDDATHRGLVDVHHGGGQVDIVEYAPEKDSVTVAGVVLNYDPNHVKQLILGWHAVRGEPSAEQEIADALAAGEIAED